MVGSVRVWAMAAALWAAVAGGAEAARIALVIGNDAYENVAPLQKAVADARAYRRHFEDERGFDHVIYAENADEDEMAEAIGRFLATVRPGDVATVVFSGHGVQLDANRGDTLFLLPIDVPALDPSQGDVEFRLNRSAISFADLREQLTNRGASTRVFVLDACRDNPFDLSGDGTRSVGLTRGLARIRSTSGEFIFYAAAPGAKALDRLSNADDDPNSVFSRVFLRHFQPGAYLEDIANTVQSEVYSLAQEASFVQEPYYSDGVRGKACLENQCGVDAVALQTPGSATPPAQTDAKSAFDYAKSLGTADAFRDVAEIYPDSFWGRRAAREADRLESASDASASQLQTRSEFLSAQADLKRLGYYDGAIDGVWGAGSERALSAFQSALGVADTRGALTADVLAALRAADPTASGLTTETADGGMCEFEIFHSDRGVIEGAASHSFSPGEQFVVCFQAVEAGYVTLWDRMPLNGEFERLVPNDNFRGEGVRAAKVSAGDKRCFGDGSDGYYLFMDPADGVGRGYMWLLFSKDEAQQTEEGSFASISAFRQGFARVGAGAIAIDQTPIAAEETGCRPSNLLRYAYEVSPTAQ